jgi:hypothetical protein
MSYIYLYKNIPQIDLIKESLNSTITLINSYDDIDFTKVINRIGIMFRSFGSNYVPFIDISNNIIENEISDISNTKLNISNNLPKNIINRDLSKNMIKRDLSKNIINLDLSNNKYFGNNFIQLLTDLLNNNHTLVEIDLISCDFNKQLFIDLVEYIYNKYGIKINYSLDKTGNYNNGGNWILESSNENIKDIYFTNKIDDWKNVLDRTIISNTNINIFFDPPNSLIFDDNNLLISLNKDVSFNNSDQNAYFDLSSNWRFDGSGHTINIKNNPTVDLNIEYNGINEYMGLINTNDNTIIQNLVLDFNNSISIQDPYGGLILNNNIYNSSISGCIINYANDLNGNSGGLIGESCCNINLNNIQMNINGNINGNAGGLIGPYYNYIYNNSQNVLIQNCAVSVSGDLNGDYVSGLIGFSSFNIDSDCSSNITISGCIVNIDGDVNSINGCGLIGQNSFYIINNSEQYDVLIQNCIVSVSGDLSGDYVSGLIGNNSFNIIESDCSSNITISGCIVNIDGDVNSINGCSFIGSNSFSISELSNSEQNVLIHNCAVSISGDLNGDNVSGLIGTFSFIYSDCLSNITISGCIVNIDGDVNSINGCGLIGSNSFSISDNSKQNVLIHNCAVSISGDLNGDSEFIGYNNYISGLIGYNSFNIYSNCSSNITISGCIVNINGDVISNNGCGLIGQNSFSLLDNSEQNVLIHNCAVSVSGDLNGYLVSGLISTDSFNIDSDCSSNITISGCIVNINGDVNSNIGCSFIGSYSFLIINNSEQNVLIHNCAVSISGDLNGDYVSGLIGYNTFRTINNCSNNIIISNCNVYLTDISGIYANTIIGYSCNLCDNNSNNILHITDTSCSINNSNISNIYDVIITEANKDLYFIPSNNINYDINTKCIYLTGDISYNNSFSHAYINLMKGYTFDGRSYTIEIINNTLDNNKGVNNYHGLFNIDYDCLSYKDTLIKNINILINEPIYIDDYSGGLIRASNTFYTINNCNLINNGDLRCFYSGGLIGYGITIFKQSVNVVLIENLKLYAGEIYVNNQRMYPYGNKTQTYNNSIKINNSIININGNIIGDYSAGLLSSYNGISDNGNNYIDILNCNITILGDISGELTSGVFGSYFIDCSNIDYLCNIDNIKISANNLLGENNGSIFGSFTNQSSNIININNCLIDIKNISNESEGILCGNNCSGININNIYDISTNRNTQLILCGNTYNNIIYDGTEITSENNILKSISSMPLDNYNFYKDASNNYQLNNKITNVSNNLLNITLNKIIYPLSIIPSLTDDASGISIIVTNNKTNFPLINPTIYFVLKMDPNESLFSDKIGFNFRTPVINGDYKIYYWNGIVSEITNDSSKDQYYVKNNDELILYTNHFSEFLIDYSYVPCIGHESIILMADGTYKKMIDIRRGDYVQCMNEKIPVSRVKYTKFNMDMYCNYCIIPQNTQINNTRLFEPLLITGYHPILINKQRIPVEHIKFGLKNGLYKIHLDCNYKLISKEVILCDLQFDKPTYYNANGIWIQSSSPYTKNNPLPYELYWDETYYSDKLTTDDPEFYQEPLITKPVYGTTLITK